ncbi:MAG: ribosome-associated translation inhibitor RaiA [Verrucomicrobiota bacterium]|nr:ribosome-associated translation inhibitor RaiA [Verrucomicrobiota bacterium]
MDKKEFAKEGYTIYIVGKHLEITDAIRTYVSKKLEKAEQLCKEIIDVTVTLDTQKLETDCSILMNCAHYHIKVHANTDNLYAAIDKASDRLLQLIRRYKGKLQSHRAKSRSAVDIHVNIIQPLRDTLQAINDEIAAETAKEQEDLWKVHPVVARETMQLKILTQDEAVMKMEITGEPFLIYRSEEDQKMKLIYRRGDENYGLVQVQ